MRKKILVSAYGCEPFSGSEAGVGWNWIIQLAEFYDLWVITRENNRKLIEANFPDHLKESVHFCYYDTCSLIRKIKNKEKRLYLYYFFWQLGIIKIIRKLIKKIKFDYSMHLSFGSLWMPTFLPFFNIPFIWGPIGGADGVPKSYLKILPIKQKIIQSFRYILIKTTRINPFVFLPSKAAVAILCRTNNNKEAIPLKYRSKCHVVLETAMSEEGLFNDRNKCRTNSVINIVSTGRLVPFKNISMAIEIIKRVIEDGYNVYYTIVGKGIEEKKIKKLIHKYDLEDRVNMLGQIPRLDVLKRLSESDIYLFPSLREGGAWSLMEAMASGLATVCFDWTGTGIITDDSCAIRIRPGNPKEDLSLFVNAIENLIDCPEKCIEYGINAQKRIKEIYNWKEKALFFNKVIKKIEIYNK